jgi:putative transposase
VRNHATAVQACDFFVAISATFRILYVFVVLDVGTRQIRHWNVTEHPTAEWTAQQFRMVMSGDERIDSSFMTTTASTPRRSIARSRRWG